MQIRMTIEHGEPMTKEAEHDFHKKLYRFLKENGFRMTELNGLEVAQSIRLVTPKEAEEEHLKRKAAILKGIL